MAPPRESLSMMDPPVTLISALIVRDGCFELSYKSECRIILSDLVYPLMANEMGNEMGNLLSLTAVLFHGYYTVVQLWKEQWFDELGSVTCFNLMNSQMQCLGLPFGKIFVLTSSIIEQTERGLDQRLNRKSFCWEFLRGYIFLELKIKFTPGSRSSILRLVNLN